MQVDNRIFALYVARGRKRGSEGTSSPHWQVQIESAASAAGLPALEWMLATNQKAALRQARLTPPRLAVVEVDVPGGRVRFCEALKVRLPALRVVGLGTRHQSQASVFDWFIPVPLDTAQVQQIITLALGTVNGHILQRGPISLNLDTRTVITPKGQYHMTPKQCALLKLFLVRHNQVLDRKEIMLTIWETDYLADTRTLDVHIRWLRERIETDPSRPQFLVTERRRGYSLRVLP